MSALFGTPLSHIEHVARNMGDQQIRRLPVLNRSKRLIGVLALGDIAAACAPKPTGEALNKISRPGYVHH